jgi:hypothetical protein
MRGFDGFIYTYFSIPTGIVLRDHKPSNTHNSIDRHNNQPGNSRVAEHRTFSQSSFVRKEDKWQNSVLTCEQQIPMRCSAYCCR